MKKIMEIKMTSPVVHLIIIISNKGVHQEDKDNNNMSAVPLVVIIKIKAVEVIDTMVIVIASVDVEDAEKVAVKDVARVEETTVVEMIKMVVDENFKIEAEVMVSDPLEKIDHMIVILVVVVNKIQTVVRQMRLLVKRMACHLPQ